VEQVFNLFVKFAFAEGNDSVRTGCAMTLEWKVGQTRADLEVCTTWWFFTCSVDLEYGVFRRLPMRQSPAFPCCRAAPAHERQACRSFDTALCCVVL